MTDKERADRLETIAVWAIAEHTPLSSVEARYAMAVVEVENMLQLNTGYEYARKRILASKKYLKEHPEIAALAAMALRIVNEDKEAEEEEEHDED
jgi:hypothetical protein